MQSLGQRVAHRLPLSPLHISDDLSGTTSLPSQPQQTSIATKIKIFADRSFTFAPHHLLFGIVFQGSKVLTSTFVCHQLFLKYAVEVQALCKLYGFRCYFLTS